MIMKISIKCATSLAALVLMAPLAIAQQPMEDRGGGAPAAQKAPEHNAGGSERGLERSGDNRNEGAGQRGEERANNKKSDSDARRSDSNNRNEAAGANNERAGETGNKTRQNVKDADSTGEKPRERREDRAGSDDSKQGRSGTAESRSQKDDGDRGKTAADREPQRSGDQANDRSDSAKDRDRTADQASGEVKPEDRQKAEQVRAKVDEKDRDRLREKAFQGDVRRASNVNIRVNIGTRLPRTVAVYDLPTDIIELAPAYRGYRYVVVGDDYCIIDPETYLIVPLKRWLGRKRRCSACRRQMSAGRWGLVQLPEHPLFVARPEYK
jgi:hypothetical protein